jgi:hypothetical protein
MVGLMQDAFEALIRRAMPHTNVVQRPQLLASRYGPSSSLIFCNTFHFDPPSECHYRWGQSPSPAMGYIPFVLLRVVEP